MDFRRTKSAARQAQKDSQVFRRIQRIHFVGIGGIGMCGLAELLHNQGYRISGSDLKEGPTVQRLRTLGVDVQIGHSATNVEGADVVVYSSAVRKNNPELLEAEKLKLPVIPRAEMLAEVMRLKNGIAVGGSHGKTTTTSLIAHLLQSAGLDPTAVIGGRVRAGESDATGARLGRGEFLVAEADESDGSFLRLSPVIAVITNIDPEHLDHYGNFEAVQEAFVSFANRIPFWGLTIVCIDHPGVQAILPRLTRRTLTYGFSPQADLIASDLEFFNEGTRFRVRHHTTELGELWIPLLGKHNVLNTLAALAVARELEVSFANVEAALKSFLGVERRFETKGEVANIRIVDDYGHHPAEIRATLAAAREAQPKRVVVIFQPHRYTRTQNLFEDFATAFYDADLLLLTEVYPAGEAAIPGIDAAHLADAVRAHGHRDVRCIPDLEKVIDALLPDLQAGDLVITLGAGSVSKLGPVLLRRLRENEH